MSTMHVRPAPLLAMAALALSSLLLVGWHRFHLPSTPADPVQQLGHKLVKRVDLSFIDQADGGVLVTRLSDGVQIAHIAVGEGGFVRATLRSLIRDHPITKHHFHLAMTDSGQLLLWDPLSGRVLDLKAYGSSNRQVFLEFLLASESRP